MHGSRPYTVKSPSWERTETPPQRTDRDDDGEKKYSIFLGSFLWWLFRFFSFVPPSPLVEDRAPIFDLHASWCGVDSSIETWPLKGKKRGALELSE